MITFTIFVLRFVAVTLTIAHTDYNMRPRPLHHQQATFRKYAALTLIALVCAAMQASAQAPNRTDTTARAAKPAPRSFSMDAKGKKIVSYTASNGKTYKVGDTITLGNATGQNGFYFILTAGGMHYNGDYGENLSPKWEGAQFIIKGMDNGSKFYANQSVPHPMFFFIEIKGLFGGLYHINVEQALEAKEMQ